MVPELGHFALILALGVALVQGIVPIVGSLRGDVRLMSVARPAAAAQFLVMGTAYACLVKSFVSDDFSVLYVAQNSNSMLPILYKVTAVWGGHEGSMLLWVSILSLWTIAVAAFSRRLPLQTVANALGVMGLITVGFVLFLLLTSNPFERLLPAAADGRDLNPLLQDPGMAIHPPLLYMGYVGFAVAFAFAMSALISGHLDAAWARWSRPWTTIAWMFLTLGIAIGSWWAYYELGWGGWWFWDPVENASFMPWLVGTALIHSLAVTEKRGGFKNWTVLLAIMAFSLSLLGTFLVRSGVLTSVHAFATDPKRGVFVLGFLVFIVGVSLLLYAWRAPSVGLGGKFDMLSRETFLLVNNVLLVVAAGAVLLGTLYPLFLDALGLGKVSVGPPYFEAVFFPLMAPLIVLMGLGPFARWKQARFIDFWPRLSWSVGLAVTAAMILPLLLGRWAPVLAFGVLLGIWALASSMTHLIEHIRHGGGGSEAIPARLASIPLAKWGMLVAHVGIGVFILGVAVVKAYETASEVKMRPGERVSAGGYDFQLMNLEETRGPNYMAVRATMNVSREGGAVTVMYPEKRMYLVQQMPMTEAAIDTNMFRDLYVSLGEPVDDGSWIVRVQHKPLVIWIWSGCLLMALGGLLAASDRRYRLRRAEIQPGTQSAVPA
jgi:cytochrome c-type biogenesis protein CcmF